MVLMNVSAKSQNVHSECNCKMFCDIAFHLFSYSIHQPKHDTCFLWLCLHNSSYILKSVISIFSISPKPSFLKLNQIVSLG